MSGEPVVNALGKSDVVNRGLLAPTGVNSTIVDDAALGAIKGRYDALYDGVRSSIADPVEPSQFDDLLETTSELMTQRVPEERFYRAVEGLQTAIQGNRMDGTEYLRVRSELGKFARATDDDVSADMYYGVIRGLDNVMEEQGAVGLKAANELWRYRQVLQGPGVLNDATGNVNLVSYLRQMRRMFPGIRDGNAPQNMQDSYALARDAQMFAGFQDSGTARRSLVPGEQLLREGALQLRLQPSEMLGGGVGRAAGQSVQDGDSETE